MNEVEVGGGPASSRPWKFYPSLNSEGGGNREETPWNSFGEASMNAISFGFVATAILISMFLIIAILEHLFRSNHNSLSSSSQIGVHESALDSAKLTNQRLAMRSNTSGLSVVMAGQKYPSCIAQPAPLIPFTREPIHWPPHQHTLPFPLNS